MAKYTDYTILIGGNMIQVRQAAAHERELKAALAQPEPEGPSLEEVEDLCEEHCFNVEDYESIECLQGLINDALARYGRQPTPPAAGEVAELVAWLLDGGEDAAANGWDHQARQFGRAAELLQRLSPPLIGEDISGKDS